METTQRFTDRVDAYVRYRPGYPAALLPTLERETGLTQAVPIADIGSGTGISTRIFLEAGYEVFAVEPNEPMRRACEGAASGFDRFHSIDGTAEDTHLAARSVGAVVAGQTFHWFDHARARVEMKRILREPGLVVLFWNERRVQGPFLEAYEALLLERGLDYARVRHQDAANPAIVRAFYGSEPRVFSFPNEQRFDRAGVIGRALSSSYVPNAGHPRHEAFMHGLEAILDQHAPIGEIVFAYDTRVYVGKLLP